MKNDLPCIVRFVSFPATRLIDNKGKYHQSIRVDEALKMSRLAGLDLVCFSRPAVGEAALCKIVDFGKWKYENEKKKKDEEKKRKKELKEIRFSPNIEMNDVQHKINQVLEFLDRGDDVVMTMRLKGREKLHFADAEAKMTTITGLLNGHGKETSRKKEANLIVVKMSGSKQAGQIINSPTQTS